MKNKYGLKPSEQVMSIKIITQHISSCQIILYGSRAKGNFSDRSAIDLVIANTELRDRHILANIIARIVESDLPYLCDIQYLANIKNPALLKHIERQGKIIYSLKK